jgi:hypothetical protein
MYIGYDIGGGGWTVESNLIMIQNLHEWDAPRLMACTFFRELVDNDRVQILKEISHIKFMNLTYLSVAGNHIQSVEGIAAIHIPNMQVIHLRKYI